VALSRKREPNRLQSLVDKEGLIEAQMAKAQGLVTDVAYETDAVDRLRKLTGATDQAKPFPQVSLAQYAPRALAAAARKQRGKDKIAVVYAEGVIIDGDGDPAMQGLVPGDGFARMLRKVRQREDVKAVVLRVNSPGGSAGASMAIAEELRRFKSDRP